MNFDIDPADEAFRQEVRGYLREHLPADLLFRARFGDHSPREDQAQVLRILHRRGWSVPHWPREHGGPGWSAMQRHIFMEELYAAGAPYLSRIGLNMVGPVVAAFGSPEQQRRFLPPLARGEEFWCQGFSEPNSGSDLASLRTRAVRDGDHYVVNGGKIWTSEGHYADWMFALVRTNADVKPQLGISVLCIPMSAPGIKVRPLISIDGGHTLNQVFLDDVRVPVQNLLGEEGKGWSYAKFLLTFERSMNAESPMTRKDLETLKRIAAQVNANGRPLLDDPQFRARLAALEVDLLALDYSVLRVLTLPEDDPTLLSVAGVLKVRGSELYQRVMELSMEAIGPYAAVQYPPPEDAHLPREQLPPQVDPALGLTSRAMFRRAATVYGGSNEIQRNIIAKAILDL
ncbi:MAG: acyl-CoA dehydrogenase family protein [Gammaproteobacteria bacterium]